MIFVSQRRADDPDGYAAAAQAMAERAAAQPGFCGIDSARDVAGLGITVSYWADDAAAIAWRDDAEHTVIRDAGREQWYDSYQVIVSRVERDYAWTRPARTRPA